jgi:DNA-binding response OmpR family regulator
MATRVLIAEDDLHIVELLTFVLEREGYAVAAAVDGEAAIEHLRRDPPDLLILDVMLPRLNGFEVLKTIRADAKLKDLPVIVLTAKGQTQDRRTAEELGIDEFMTKPFSNRDVVATVRRVTGSPRP